MLGGTEQGIEQLTTQLLNGNATEADSLLQQARTGITASLERLEKMGAFRGDDSLRQAALNYMKTNDDLLKAEYQQAIDLLKGNNTAETEDQLTAILVSANQKRAKALEALVQQQQAFIRKYNLIVGNDMMNRMT